MQNTIRTLLSTFFLLALLFSAMSAASAHAAANIIVNAAADNTTAGDTFCTLREAINNANGDSDTTSGDCAAGSGADTITFAGDYAITLTSALPAIATEMTIDGTGQSVTISGNDAYRVFNVSAAGALTLNNLSVTHGADSSGVGGGAINNVGTLNITGSTFANNLASNNGYGGAIYNTGTVIVSNSTFYGNTASNGWGGAIVNDSGATLTMVNSTFSHNSANVGGAIANFGTLHLMNSILANSANGGNDCGSGSSLATDINNLIETNDAGNPCGVPVSSADPNLGTLANNGGPTQTMALLYPSPAINAGDSATCETTDQRGVSRPQGSGCDIGAFEGLSAVTTLSSSLDPSTYGDSVTFTATLSGSYGTPTGTVDFAADGSPLCSSVALSGGQSTCTTAALSGGSHTITLSYSGDANYYSSGDSLEQIVNQAAQTITFDALGDKTYGDADFTISATASSGLTVSFTSTTTGVCTVSGTTVSLVAPGACSITASQDGGGNYNAAPNVVQGFNVKARVTPSAGTNGTISPDTLQALIVGNTAGFTITPDSGYHVDTPVGGTCGGSYTGDIYDTTNGISYTTSAVTVDCTVESSFSINQYTVSGSAGSNGILDAGTPSPQTVDHGETTQFTFKADADYHIASVTGCGVNYYNENNDVTSYTATTWAATADCTVSATFALNTFQLSVTVDGKGTVTSDSGGIDCPGTCSGTYDHGSVVSLTATPEAGAKFLGWSGDADCADGVVTMTGDVNCTAEFDKFPWDMFLPAITGHGNQ